MPPFDLLQVVEADEKCSAFSRASPQVCIFLKRKRNHESQRGARVPGTLIPFQLYGTVPLNNETISYQQHVYPEIGNLFLSDR
jgi:hypothetical protein